MNFLQQTKLSKVEWCKMEEAITNKKEQHILQMIEKGYNDPTIQYNPFISLRTFLNIDKQFDEFIFEKVIKEKLSKLNKKNILQLDSCDYFKVHSKKSISKADKIKMTNSIRLLDNSNSTTKYEDSIIEYMILREIKTLSKLLQKKKEDKKYGLTLFNLYFIQKIHSTKINTHMKDIINYILKNHLKDLSVEMILKNVSKYIEHNPIFQCETYSLYSHQKDIFQFFKQNQEQSKFVFYCAPTSSGKTLTPLALTSEYKVLFMCASKHIGLSLAKSGYFLNKKIGFAFGCSDVDQIRLNYNAINSYKEGTYKKLPDHSDGKKVEIMICDLASFECAMLYMKSFHPLEKTILFWDEPTIGLDMKTHPLHEIIEKNWSINMIPNVIFSCATLPKKDKIQSVLTNFQTKFTGALIEYIESYDQNTNLMIYDECGNILMPHMYFEDYNKMNEFIQYQSKKYYKFYNCNECAKFILYYDKNIDSTFIQTYFNTLDTVTMFHIKDIYIHCLTKISSESWKKIRETYLLENPLSTIPHKDIGCNLTTNHASSLTNGPTLYISNDVQNICKYLLHITKMDPKILQKIQEKIDENTTISSQLSKKRKNYEDKIEKFKNNEKIMEQMRFPKDILELNKEIQTLESRIHSLTLDNVFKPNTRDHFQKWNQYPELEYDLSHIYTSHVEDSDIKRVMELYTIHALYKILLLMGIGVFSNEIMPCDEQHVVDIREENNNYVEIMKMLAEQKSLYLIIANSDYIYGTNYQFSHCYLGKDMKNMTQEKIIQSIGRIGRQDKNKHFSFRFRSKEQMDILYQIPETSIEAENMNRLFKSN